jgi:hypothetical protein
MTALSRELVKDVQSQEGERYCSTLHFVLLRKFRDTSQEKTESEQYIYM